MADQLFNRERGEYPLVLAGQTYTLRLTTNSMALVEELAKGKAWDQIVDGLFRGSVTSVRLFLWAALRDKHPEVASGSPAALERIGDLIDETGGLTAITDQIRAFVQTNAKPDDGKGGGTADPLAAGGNGTGVRPTLTPSPSA